VGAEWFLGLARWFGRLVRDGISGDLQKHLRRREAPVCSALRDFHRWNGLADALYNFKAAGVAAAERGVPNAGELLRLSYELGPQIYEQFGDVFADKARGAILQFDEQWYQEYLMWRWRDHPWYARAVFDVEYARLRHRFLDRDAIDHILSYRPPGWDEHCKRMGYRQGSSPIVIRIILRHPAIDSKALGELPNHFEQYPIVYEFRPKCQALSISLVDGLLQRLGLGPVTDGTALRVGRANPNTAGTMGGVLRGTRTGDYYLVSCAHVLGGIGTPTFTPGPTKVVNLVKSASSSFLRMCR
jgi:hypothetical protein